MVMPSEHICHFRETHHTNIITVQTKNNTKVPRCGRWSGSEKETYEDWEMRTGIEYCTSRQEGAESTIDSLLRWTCMSVPISSSRRLMDQLNREASFAAEKKAREQSDHSSNRTIDHAHEGTACRNPLHARPLQESEPTALAHCSAPQSALSPSSRRS